MPEERKKERSTIRNRGQAAQTKVERIRRSNNADGHILACLHGACCECSLLGYSVHHIRGE